MQDEKGPQFADFLTLVNEKIEKYIAITRNKLLYHMTRTAPRAISLENHKRKGPV